MILQTICTKSAVDDGLLMGKGMRNFDDEVEVHRGPRSRDGQWVSAGNSGELQLWHLHYGTSKNHRQSPAIPL